MNSPHARKNRKQIKPQNWNVDVQCCTSAQIGAGKRRRMSTGREYFLNTSLSLLVTPVATPQVYCSDQVKKRGNRPVRAPKTTRVFHSGGVSQSGWGPMGTSFSRDGPVRLWVATVRATGSTELEFRARSQWEKSVSLRTPGAGPQQPRRGGREVAAAN